MLARARSLLAVAAVCATLVLGGCATSLPPSAEPLGADYPSGGVTTAVAWPSDWLEGFTGESDAVGGSIVGLRLEFVDATWVWRVRSHDPGRDVFGEQVTEPRRGREALVDASTHRTIATQSVTLTDAELADGDISAYDAAQLSGETYPGPRLIALERAEESGDIVWRLTTLDTATGAQSTEMIADPGKR